MMSLVVVIIIADGEVTTAAREGNARPGGSSIIDPINPRLKVLELRGETVDSGTSCAERQSFARWLQRE